MEHMQTNPGRVEPEKFNYEKYNAGTCEEREAVEHTYDVCVQYIEIRVVRRVCRRWP